MERRMVLTSAFTMCCAVLASVGIASTASAQYDPYYFPENPAYPGAAYPDGYFYPNGVPQFYYNQDVYRDGVYENALYDEYGNRLYNGYPQYDVPVQNIDTQYYYDENGNIRYYDNTRYQSPDYNIRYPNLNGQNDYFIDPDSDYYDQQRRNDPTVTPNNNVVDDDEYPVDLTPYTQRSDQYYAEKIINTFREPGALNDEDETPFDNDTGVYDNDSLDDLAFDIRAYINHDCYEIAPVVQERCVRDFGPYADLRQILLNGTLERLIERYADIEEVVPMIDAVRREQQRQNVIVPRVDLTDSVQQRIDSRRDSDLVWGRCLELHNFTYTDAARCYLRNLRMITDPEVPVNLEEVE